MNHDVRPLQKALAAKGHNLGIIDGVFGVQSREAMRAYQSLMHLTVSDQPTHEVCDSLGIDLGPDFPYQPVLPPKTTDYTLGRSFLSLIIQIALKGGPNVNSIPDIAGWLNNSSILGFLRNILLSAGNVLVASGLFTGTQWEQIVGAIIVVVSAILSWISNKRAADAKAVAKAVDAHPDLNVIAKSDGTAAIAVK